MSPNLFFHAGGEAFRYDVQFNNPAASGFVKFKHDDGRVPRRNRHTKHRPTVSIRSTAAVSVNVNDPGSQWNKFSVLPN
jgi:hypothetical protein